MTSGDPGAPVEAAPAKLNLYLHVTGRRDDGYHLLDSLVVFTEAGDTLRVEPADDLSLTVEGPFAAALQGEGDNLVLKAARALQAQIVTPAQAGVQSSPEKSLDARLRGHDSQLRGAHLILTKNLPVASGIGGGSADAAAALRLLRRFWSIAIEDAQLRAIAATLGADVPSCLQSRSVFLGGVGEALTPAPALPAFGLVLVNPGIPLPTPQVFAARRGGFSSAARFSQAPRDARELASLLAERRNDLEPAATSLVPEIAALLDALRASPGCRLARLSGSGATCFGIYDTPEAASHAASGLRAPGWWLVPTCLADRP